MTPETAAARTLIRLESGFPVSAERLLLRLPRTAVMNWQDAIASGSCGEEDRNLLLGLTEAVTLSRRGSDGDLGRVVICGLRDPLRRNFVLAHELGHIALRHSCSKPEEEQAADLFAFCLLCPETLLSGIQPAPETLARLCRVPENIARRRLRMPLNRLPEDVRAALCCAGFSPERLQETP